MDAYETRKKDWEDLEVTREELKNLTECIKKEEFRKLLIEYAEEVTDPENKKIYQKEITQLEKQRGVDVTFVNPEPGYVIKTSVNGEKKCFLNISKSDIVARPTSQPSYEQGHHGLQWSVPYTLVPPRDDLDNKNVRCTVFDVVFHPDTIYLASKNARFREIVNDTAMDGVETNFKVKLDKKNIKFPKISFKGMSQPAVIRTPSKNPPKENPDEECEIYQKLMEDYDETRERYSKPKMEKPQRAPPPTTYYKNKEEAKLEPEESQYVTPKFQIKYQSDIEMEDFVNAKDAKMHAAIPKKIVVIVDLPLLKSATDASLDVQERALSLTSEKPARYSLELPLPYSVDADLGNAKFDSKYKKLTITLPVIRNAVVLTDNREDSGVDSDQSSPLPVSLNDPLPNYKNDIDCNDMPLSLTTLPLDNGVNGDSSYSVSLLEEPITEFLHAEHSNDTRLESVIEYQPPSLIEELDNQSEVTNECDNTALRTSSTTEINDSFMKSSIKYTLPAFACNIYTNQLAITINVKNTDPNSIHHRVLDSNSGIHILLTSIGSGFFPQHYALCFKIKKDAIDPELMTIEPWDNNVIVTLTLKDAESLSEYYFGIDEEFMERKHFSTAASFKNRLQDLMAMPNGNSEVQPKIDVQREGDSILINIRSNQLDSDDEDHINSLGKNGNCHMLKTRSISESSGDDLPNSSGSMAQAKGILKSQRSHELSRSVSESSADENGISIPFEEDAQYDSVHDGNSESDCSSLKKTVRFNDIVQRQLFRSNSSILGQRKKNQRKLKNKKRAHERRLSESENSETEEREKYKVNQKNSLEHEAGDNTKSILNGDKQSEHQSVVNMENEKLDCKKHTLRKHKNNIEVESISNACVDNTTQAVKSEVEAEFKNDLIFDLDM